MISSILVDSFRTGGLNILMLVLTSTTRIFPSLPGYTFVTIPFGHEFLQKRQLTSITTSPVVISLFDDKNHLVCLFNTLRYSLTHLRQKWSVSSWEIRQTFREKLSICSKCSDIWAPLELSNRKWFDVNASSSNCSKGTWINGPELAIYSASTNKVWNTALQRAFSRKIALSEISTDLTSLSQLPPMWGAGRMPSRIKCQVMLLVSSLEMISSWSNSLNGLLISFSAPFRLFPCLNKLS